MSFINLLKAFEPLLIKFVFYTVDQSIILINCVLLILIIFKTKLKDKQKILWILPVIIVFSIVASFLSGNNTFEKIREIIVLILPFVEILLIFKKTHILKHFAAIFAYGIVEDSVKYLMHIYLPQLKKMGEAVELCVDLLLLIVFIILYVLVYNKRHSAEKLSYLNPLTFILVCVTIIAFVLTIVMFDVNYRDSEYSWIIIVDILMFSSLIPYIIYSMLKAKQSEDYFRRALDTETRHFEIISEKDEDLRRFRHDYANHMRCILAMLEDEQTDELKQYVEKLGVDLQNTTRDFYTGNYILDIIMAEKKSIAGQDGNSIVFEGAFPKNGISNDDICTIMANALDNAIEACKNISESCDIKVKSVIKENRVAVSITNPVQNKTYIIGNSVATTKIDKNLHGFGLKSIKKTVEKYDGLMHLSSDNKIFELSFSLKF